MSNGLWEVYALKYADRNDRTRNDSFLFDPHHHHNHPMDYFIWVLKTGTKVILVDTGYDAEEAKKRGRPIITEPAKALEALGVRAEDITDVIITHLHYDHAGGLAQFPSATFYLQPAEMAYATGPCMCEDVLRMPYTGAHICEMITALYSGRVRYMKPEDEIADGVTVHCVGGHAKGLQVVRVKTASGYLCLASDATHFYENFLTHKIFPIVVDVEEMLSGFERITALASRPDLVVPGHDPLVCSLFPAFGTSGFVYRLDGGPEKELPSY